MGSKPTGAAVILLACFLAAPPVDAQSGRAPTSRIGDELQGTSWQAESVDGKPVADPSSMTLEFLPGDQVRGQAGCNRYVGPFASRGDRVTLGILRASRAECPPAQAAMQKQLIDQLHGAARGELVDGDLIFHGRHGEQIHFTRRR
jgi:heat shock protein HslJ